MALTIFKETFGKERQRLSAVRKTDMVQDHAVSTLDAIQSVVDTLRDPKTGQRYEVALGSGVQAATFVDARRIIVTHAPIFDKSLTIAEACTVMTGLVLHEVGHTLYTFPHLEAFAAEFGERKSDTAGYVDGKWTTIKADYDRLAYYLWNIADDARLEARMARRLPVAADVFPSMLTWVAKEAGMTGWRGRWDASRPMKDRVDFALYATRYPWVAVWSSDPTTRAERIWWREWRDQFVDIDDAAGLIAAIHEGLTRLRSPQRDEPTIEDPGQGEASGGEDEGEDEGDEQESQPGGSNDESEDGFGQPDFSDEDEDEDADEGGESDDDAEDGDDDGEPGKGESDGEDGEDEDGGSNGQSSDVPPDGWDEDEDGEQDGEPDQTRGGVNDLSEGGGEGMGDAVIDPVTENPNVVGSHPQDFDPATQAPQVDDLQGAAKTNYNEGRILQNHIDKVRKNERIDLGQYGAARIEVNTLY